MARCGLRGGHTLVFLLDLALFEEHLVLAPGLGVRGEQQDAGGHAVQAVHGNQVREAELVPEPDQGRFLDVRPAGGGGQEVRLVHHQQVIVLVQDVQLHRDPGLRRQGPVVPDERVVLHRRAAVQGDPRLADDLAGVEPVLDALRIDVPPAVHHVVHRGLPGPLVRQAQTRRVDAVAHGKGGLHHPTILRARPPAPPRSAPAPPCRGRDPVPLPEPRRRRLRRPASSSSPDTFEVAGNIRRPRTLPATSRCAAELRPSRPARCRVRVPRPPAVLSRGARAPVRRTRARSPETPRDLGRFRRTRDAPPPCARHALRAAASMSLASPPARRPLPPAARAPVRRTRARSPERSGDLGRLPANSRCAAARSTSADEKKVLDK